jgi:PAT family beta-lactamase induction signal transducer AmpG
MTGPRTLPALDDSHAHLYFALALQYFVQGLPLGLFTIALPAYLAQAGLGPAAIGSFLGLSFLPWTLKLLWAGLLDRWTYLPMGRRRPWLLLAQTGMLASTAAMLPIDDPVARIGLLTGLCALLNVFASLQDLATDALAVELVPSTEQSRANGIMWGAKTIGAAVAAAGGAWLLVESGFRSAILVLAVLTGVGLLVSLALRERAGERLLPWTQGQSSSLALRIQPRGWLELGRALRVAVLTRTSVRVTSASFLYHVGLGLVAAALPVFAVHELGWSALSFSQLVASSRLFAGLFVFVFAGALVARLGQRRLLLLGGAMIVLAVASVAVFPGLWSMPPAMTALLFAYKALATLLIVVFLALAMGLCWKSISALQFALYTGVANLGLATGSFLLAPIQSWLGYDMVFLLAALLCLAMVAIVRQSVIEPGA